jgi:hypothetical protein
MVARHASRSGAHGRGCGWRVKKPTILRDELLGVEGV